MTSKRVHQSRDDEGDGGEPVTAVNDDPSSQPLHQNPLGATALLPFDIVKDILTRLPVVSLIRFECVSKPFLTLIKSPDFAAAHFARSSRTPSILLRRFHNPTGSSFSLSFLDPRTTRIRDINIPFLGSLIRFPKIIGSSSGILCLDISPCYATAFALWNVSTGRFRSLPRHCLLDDLAPFWMVATGFGYDPHSDDFYLVRIVGYVPSNPPNSPDHETTRVEVFSWRNNSWKVLEHSLTEQIFASCSINEGQRGVPVNGSIHWVANGVGNSFNKKFVICYDMNNILFKRITLPDLIGDVCVKIMEYKETLAVALYPTWPVGGGRSTADRVELWVLDECAVDRDRWVKVHTYLCPFGLGPGCPVGMWNDCELIFKRHDMQCVSLALIDPSSLGIRKLPISPPDFTCDICWYVDSLVPVHGYADQNNGGG